MRAKRANQVTTGGTSRNQPRSAMDPSDFSWACLWVCKNKKRPERRLFTWCLAERVGFEPTVRLPVRLISSQVHSTTLPPLRGLHERDAEGTTQTSSQAVKPTILARSIGATATLLFEPTVQPDQPLMRPQCCQSGRNTSHA